MVVIVVVFDEIEMMKSLDVGFNVTITQIAIIIMICDWVSYILIPFYCLDIKPRQLCPTKVYALSL